MAVRRILYGLFLLAAAALFLLYDGYPGLFLLAGALALPLLSLATGIPAARALRLRLEPSVPQPLLREEGVWLLRVLLWSGGPYGVIGGAGPMEGYWGGVWGSLWGYWGGVL